MSKFCVMEFMENYNYLYNKSILLKNKKIKDAYIKKFNPFKIEKLIFNNMESFSGLKIYLPITKNDALKNNKKFQVLLEKTIKFLKNEEVDIILYKDELLKNDEIQSLDVIEINLFFLKEALNKVIKNNNLIRKNISVCVLSGDFDKTCIALNEIYDNLNFINLVDEKGDFFKYEQLTDYIFCDSGLEIGFRNSIGNADIVINLSNEPNKFLHNIDDKTIIIDIVQGIKTKINNNILVKKFKFKMQGEHLEDYELELILHAYYFYYKKYKNSENKLNDFSNIKSDFLSADIIFSSYKASV